MRCNCENEACRNIDHRAGACQRPGVTTKRLMYVGVVCWECFLASAPQFRLTEGR